MYKLPKLLTDHEVISDRSDIEVTPVSKRQKTYGIIEIIYHNYYPVFITYQLFEKEQFVSRLLHIKKNRKEGKET